MATTVISGEGPVAAEAGLSNAFAALAAGDLDGRATIYDLIAVELFGVALWRAGSREDAADVVQEVFVRLARTRATIVKVRDPRAYLLTIAHRAAEVGPDARRTSRWHRRRNRRVR